MCTWLAIPVSLPRTHKQSPFLDFSEVAFQSLQA
jgi:hypothetical protein